MALSRNVRRQQVSVCKSTRLRPMSLGPLLNVPVSRIHGFRPSTNYLHARPGCTNGKSRAWILTGQTAGFPCPGGCSDGKQTFENVSTSSMLGPQTEATRNRGQRRLSDQPIIFQRVLVFCCITRSRLQVEFDAMASDPKSRVMSRHGYSELG